MPVKVGGKGKLQSYDPATGKFGKGEIANGEPKKEEPAVVTVQWKGQTVQVVGPLSKEEAPNPRVQPLEKPNAVGFKEAVNTMGMAHKE